MPVPAKNTSNHTDLVGDARKCLYDQSRLLAPDATLSAIHDLKHWVGEELAFEEAASASFGRIISELAHSEYLDQLPPLLNKFDRLVCAYFIRRGSVPSFHGFCNAWREGVLQRVLLFAEEGLELNDPGDPPVPYALLVAGRLGRREQTLDDENRYFLIWREGDSTYFDRFVYRIMAILEQCGLTGNVGPADIDRFLWRGSLADWERVTSSHSDARNRACPDLLADLRQVCGDPDVGSEAERLGRLNLERYRSGAPFAALAGPRLAEPVALTILRGIRVEKSGEHVGSFNVARSGLDPLVHAVRLLALQQDLDPAPTLERLSALTQLRVLEEPFAKRLEGAYHLLAGLKIGREMVLEKPYINLASLPATQQQKLKEALRSVSQLQRHLRRMLVKLRRREK